MKLTKYEHACLVIEQDDKRVVIDPGMYTTSLGTPENVMVIIITHEHQDHLNMDHIKRILAANPDAKILGHKALSAEFEGLPFQIVDHDMGVEIGPFHFEFFGGLHAIVHPSIPQVANLGVMVNDTVYYPGDSYTVPNKLVNVLALPVNAPWVKFSESADYLMEIKPKIAFPTHDAFLSQSGEQLNDKMFGMFAQKVGTVFRLLPIGDPVEL